MLWVVPWAAHFFYFFSKFPTKYGSNGIANSYRNPLRHLELQGLNADPISPTGGFNHPSGQSPYRIWGKGRGESIRASGVGVHGAHHRLRDELWPIPTGIDHINQDVAGQAFDGDGGAVHPRISLTGHQGRETTRGAGMCVLVTHSPKLAS